MPTQEQSSSSPRTKDFVWKVFTIILGTIVIPLFGWVWSTNVAVADIKTNLSHLKSTIDDVKKKTSTHDSNALDIVGLKKDIQYMQASLDRILVIVSKQP